MAQPGGTTGSNRMALQRGRDMKMTRKDFLKSMLAATALPLIGPANAQQTGPILIGATVPITGPLSLTGKQYFNSLTMVEEDINKAGGINGRNIKIVFEDTQASNSTAVNAFVKLRRKPSRPSSSCRATRPRTSPSLPS
jgi:branched-chain amino acid transport system substrate-binding protein